MFLLEINFDGFSLAKLYQQILHLRVLKKIYHFPKKSELLKFILPVKISWLIFSAVSRAEMGNLQRSVPVTFSSCFCCWILHSWLPRAHWRRACIKVDRLRINFVFPPSLVAILELRYQKWPIWCTPDKIHEIFTQEHLLTCLLRKLVWKNKVPKGNQVQEMVWSCSIQAKQKQSLFSWNWPPTTKFFYHHTIWLT